jgi:hypothetical protein
LIALHLEEMQHSINAAVSKTVATVYHWEDSTVATLEIGHTDRNRAGGIGRRGLRCQ